MNTTYPPPWRLSIPGTQTRDRHHKKSLQRRQDTCYELLLLVELTTTARLHRQTDIQTTIGLHSGWLFWKSRLFFLFSYGAIFCLACVNLFKCVKRWRRRPPLAFCCYCIFKLSSMDSGMTLAKGYYGGYIRRAIECWVLAAVWAREEGGGKDYEKYIINILIKMHNKLRQAPK